MLFRSYTHSLSAHFRCSNACFVLFVFRSIQINCFDIDDLLFAHQNNIELPFMTRTRTHTHLHTQGTVQTLIYTREQKLGFLLFLLLLLLLLYIMVIMEQYSLLQFNA